jgi:hypothetical protein
MNVYVFGTNEQGFHGAGDAGYLMLGVKGNRWREVKVPGTNLYLNEVPNGTKGLFNVKGISRGIMEGLNGLSYGIQTVTKPEKKRSISLKEIGKQLKELSEYAKLHPENTFILRKIGCGNAGYAINEIVSLIQFIDFPPNVIKKELIDAI